MKKSEYFEVNRFPPDKQLRMDNLLDKNSEGTISGDELAELKKLVAEAEQLIVQNSKMLRLRPTQ